jgi:hypothetical protein
MIGDQTGTLLNGYFVLLRSSSEDSYSSWNEICKFKLFQWDTTQIKEICKDYCL